MVVAGIARGRGAGVLPAAPQNARTHLPFTTRANMMNSLWSFNPFLLTAPPMVSVPFASTVFTIGCDEPVDPVDQVLAYMNRPKNVLRQFAPHPVAKSEDEQGGVNMDEATEPLKLVFPMKFGCASKDNNDIPTPGWALMPPAEFLDAPTVASHAPEPSLIQPQSPADALMVVVDAAADAHDALPSAVLLTCAAAEAPAVKPAPRVQAAPKQAVKQQARAPAASQWPSEQSIVSTVTAAAAGELNDALFSGGLETRMQHMRKGTKTVSVPLPSEFPLGKGLLFMHQLLDREVASDDKPFHRATFQRVGEAIQQKVGVDVPFDLHVLFFRSNGNVSVKATVTWAH